MKSDPFLTPCTKVKTEVFKLLTFSFKGTIREVGKKTKDRKYLQFIEPTMGLHPGYKSLKYQEQKSN